MDNAQWAALLAKHQDPFAAAEEMGGRWMPDPGTYTAIITDVNTGIRKDGAPYWSIKGQLLDGMDSNGAELAGKTFDIGFFDTSTEVKAGFLKGFAHVISGVATSDLMTADEVVRNSVGKVVRGEVVRSTKNPQYLNWRTSEVVEIADNSTDAAVPETQPGNAGVPVETETP